MATLQEQYTSVCSAIDRLLAGDMVEEVWYNNQRTKFANISLPQLQHYKAVLEGKIARQTRKRYSMLTTSKGL